MFGDGMQKNELPLIIVCDDKDMVYANYLEPVDTNKKT